MSFIPWLTRFKKRKGAAQPRDPAEEKRPDIMWIIAGLGNPGSRYEETAHNLGFDVARLLARRHGMRWTASNRAKAEIARGQIAGEDVMLAMPTTFMNVSGEALGPLARYYKIPESNVLVVSDDVALPWGKVRLRSGGSAGGHNGLKSIIRHLGTDKFPRVRIGCEPEDWKGDLAAYVLAKLRGDALDLARHMAEIGADAVEDVVKRGIVKAQNEFNGYDALKTE